MTEPIAPHRRPRVDVYVRTLNVLRASMRTQEVADGVHLDWQPDHEGVERLAGVEVLGARGVEVNGLDVQTGRPYGTAPGWLPELYTDSIEHREITYRVAIGRITAKQAIARLVAHGHQLTDRAALDYTSAELRHRSRQYGKASETVGALRDRVAKLEADRRGDHA